MPKRLAAALFSALLSICTLCSVADTALAQATTPSLPGPPQPTPRMPLGSPGGSGSYVVSAAANEHASFFWVMDSVQRVVTLCEKAENKEFTCTKKPLP